MPRIELLGLAARYAGVSQLDCSGATLEQLLQDLGAQCPGFSARCPTGELLPTGLIVCINERRFTSNLAAPVDSTDRVLILSADVGG